jgi:hypothetical protein
VDLALEYFRSYSTFEESFGYDNFSLEDLCWNPFIGLLKHLVCAKHLTVESDADNQGFVPSSAINQDLSWNFVTLASVEASRQTIGSDRHFVEVEV